MNEQKVIDLCGDYPTDFSKVDVAINPGYVFQNDTSYSSVQLWDIEGNTVFVNSFLECEHYVMGGWYYPKVNESLIELNSHLIFGGFSFNCFKVFIKNIFKDKECIKILSIN